MNKKLAGFTLMELMIVLSIIAILAAITLPSYQNYVKKSRRVDGMSSLHEIQLEQEKYRSNNTTYGTLAQAYGGVSTSSQGYYTLAITGNTGTGYVATATAVAGKSQTSDSAQGTSCSTLTLTVSGINVTRTPAACW